MQLRWTGPPDLKFVSFESHQIYPRTAHIQSGSQHVLCLQISGVPEDDEYWTSEQDHDEEEEEIEAPQTHLPRQQLAKQAPREKTVVEPTPSHDNTPAFAACSVLEGTQPADRINQRPAYGLCIYDVTQDESPARAEQMARAIFERTKADRRRSDSDPDRIEVVPLPCHELLYWGVVTFHEHFLRDGILDLELTASRDKGS